MPPRPRCIAASCCHYQAPDHQLPGGSSASGNRELSASLRSFRAIAQEYLRNEERLYSWSELLLFGTVIAISAWPVAVAIELAVIAANWR
jgi:hypothetical protein